MKRRMLALVSGVSAAMLPVVAGAVERPTYEASSRALDAGADIGSVMLVTILATAGLFLVAAIGYLYRRERGLEWRFQQPDAPHEDHH